MWPRGNQVQFKMKMCSCRQLCEVCWRRSGRWEQLSFVVCLLWVNEFKTCFLQPHPALQSQERGGGGGPGLWARDSWTNRGNREREGEEGEGEGTLPFPLSVPRNLNKPVYLGGPRALRALWVLSFGDRWKEMSRLRWNLRPTPRQSWTGLAERAEVWIRFRLAGRDQKEQQTEVLNPSEKKNVNKSHSATSLFNKGR